MRLGCPSALFLQTMCRLPTRWVPDAWRTGFRWRLLRARLVRSSGLKSRPGQVSTNLDSNVGDADDAAPAAGPGFSGPNATRTGNRQCPRMTTYVRLSGLPNCIGPGTVRAKWARFGPHSLQRAPLARVSPIAAAESPPFRIDENNNAGAGIQFARNMRDRLAALSGFARSPPGYSV